MIGGPKIVCDHDDTPHYPNLECDNIREVDVSEHRMHESYGKNTETGGGSRYSEGKPSMTWAPWLGMMEVCRVSEQGAEKYAPLDWKIGQSFQTLMNSAMRHMLKAMASPQERDPESGLLHVAHAAWNLLCLLHFVEVGEAEDLDNVSCWEGVPADVAKFHGLFPHSDPVHVQAAGECGEETIIPKRKRPPSKEERNALSAEEDARAQALGREMAAIEGLSGKPGV